jgi:uncharacterized phage protein (TIGR02220 family)
MSGLRKKRTNSDASLRVLSFLNEHGRKRFRPGDVNQRLIDDRLGDGITELELRQIVVRKTAQWRDNREMCYALRPKTLFNRTNCEQYLGELVPDPVQRNEYRAAH